MSIDAGTFNRKITINEIVGVADGTGQEFGVPSVKYRLWASYRAPNGMATLRDADSSMPIGPSRCSWRIRYRPTGITKSMSVGYAGTNYNIVDIKHDHDRKAYTDLVCEVGATDG